MKHNKRGISPLIATVLLIGFTIVLAALVMRWGSELFETTTATQGCAAQARIECSTNVDVKLSSVVTSNTQLDVIVSSENNKEIKGFWFRGKDANGASSQLAAGATFTQEDKSAPVPPYTSGTYTFTFDDGGDATEDPGEINATKAVEVIPIIDYTHNDGSTCEMQCTEKAKTLTFPWS